MNRELRTQLTARIQHHVLANSTDMADAEFYNPVSTYAGEAHAAAEQTQLFRRYPLVAGHVSQLRDPGSYFTVELCGRPVLVARDAGGTVSAFLNVCRHRGAKVVEDAAGAARRFTCPYHAWSYDLGGRLVAIPEPDGFCGVSREERGLVPLPCEVRHGLVWVLPEGNELDVRSHLGSLDAELAAYGLDNYVEERAQLVHTEVNWKLVVDGFLEAYHLPFLHSSTIGPYIRQKPTIFDGHQLHGRMVAVRKSFESLAESDPADVDVLQHVAIIYQLFPNTILVWQADHFEMWNCFPDGENPARCVSRVSLLAPDAASAEQRTAYWDRNWKVLMDTVEAEDFRVGRTMQRGYRSGAQQDVVFGRNEPALQHFHRNLSQVVQPHRV